MEGVEVLTRFFGKQALSVWTKYKPGPEVLQSVLLKI